MTGKYYRLLTIAVMTTAWIFALGGGSFVNASAAEADTAVTASTQAARPRNRGQMRRDEDMCLTRPSRAQPLATQAIDACERAVADPTPEGQIRWEHQAILLVSKAIWLYGEGNLADALSALDQADSLATNQHSLTYEGSTAIASTMLRALVFREAGRASEAIELLHRARTRRPYALVIARAINHIELSLRQDILQSTDLTEQMLLLDPSAARALTYQYLANGDIAAAARVGGMTQFARPALLGGWRLNSQPSESQQFKEQIEFRFLSAYLYAATGQATASEHEFLDARRQVSDYVGPEPLPTANRRRVPQREVESWIARSGDATSLAQTELIWRDAISIRQRLTQGAPPSILDEPSKVGVLSLPIVVDLLMIVAQQHPDLRAQVDAVIANSRRSAAASITSLSRFDAIQLLPEHENLEDYPRFSHADGLLDDHVVGYSRTSRRDGDIPTVRFGTIYGSRAAAEELALLAAATLAQREGADNLLIVGRHLLSRTSEVAGYFSVGTVRSGHEAALLVVMIDSNALPPQWELHRSRFIRVADVLASVGARQQAIEAARSANR